MVGKKNDTVEKIAEDCKLEVSMIYIRYEDNDKESILRRILFILCCFV